MNDAIQLRQATLDDARQVWEWRNEADTRAASFNQESIVYEDHLQWFRQKLGDSQARLLVAVGADKRDVGYARLDLAGEVAEIHVSLDKGHRGRGLGSVFIRVVADYAVKDLRVRRVVAHIRQGNERSVAAFLSAAFAFAGRREIEGTDCVRMVYEPERQSISSQEGRE